MKLLARRIARVLVRYAGRSFSEDWLRFGIELLLGAILQVTVIVGIAALFKISEQVAAVLLAAALYRAYSGGAHCTAYYRCTVTGIITFLLLGCIVDRIPVQYFSLCLWFTASISAVIIFLRVPAGNPVKPVTDPQLRFKSKLFPAPAWRCFCCVLGVQPTCSRKRLLPSVFWSGWSGRTSP
ncbi:MAG: accessory gene regulator B family protein [Syntrophomonadaceae bacterium]|nr:accessory gene regulator B family protein [Syntrophomonadaceae bacterium]